MLSSGLAEDIDIYISDGIAQPYLLITFRGVDPEDAEAAGDKLMAIVKDVVTRAAEEGFPERDLTASVNQWDFRFRQYPEPQGLYRANAVYNAWLYGGDPAHYLHTNEEIAVLRELIASCSDPANTDGVTNAVKLGSEFFTDTEGFCKLTLLPSETYGEEMAAREQERVIAAIEAMNDDELEELETMNEELAAWQSTPDSDEDLATIPQLDIRDIDRTPELFSTQVSEKDGVTLLYHQIPTNGIVNINAYFPVTQLSLEELPAAALVTEFLRDLPTENYDVVALQNEIKMYIGSLSFGIDVLASDKDNSCCTPCLRARAAVLKEELPHAEDLIIEILTRTKFDDHDLMREFITQLDDACRRDAVSSGHRLALYAARSHWSSRDAATEALNGVTVTQYIHRMTEATDEELDKFSEFASRLLRDSVVRSGASISITASEPADVSGLIGMLPEGSARPESASYMSQLPERMGIAIPASVSFAIQSYNLAEAGIKPRGSISVAANIVSLAHLWNEIRVKGGSYGASMSASRTGSIFCYTYRDPDPARSLNVYKTIPEFMKGFAGMEDLDFDGFIISTVAGTEPLISPAAKGRSADDFWFSGFTDEDRIRVRGEILDTTAEDLKSWCETLSLMTEKGCVCVVGPKAALESCEDLEIVSL